EKSLSEHSSEDLAPLHRGVLIVSDALLALREEQAHATIPDGETALVGNHVGHSDHLLLLPPPLDAWAPSPLVWSLTSSMLPGSSSRNFGGSFRRVSLTVISPGFFASGTVTRSTFSRWENIARNTGFLRRAPYCSSVSRFAPGFRTMSRFDPLISTVNVTDAFRLLMRSEEHTSELQSREKLVCRR